MPPHIATLLFAIGIAGLFYLDRDRSSRVSKALWLPVIWLSIGGSRSPSTWLAMAPSGELPGQLPATSLLDQLLASALMILGAIVLVGRRRDVTRLLKANWPIMLYFIFGILSLVWSDFPGWGLKRWVRSLGDLVMVLIVVTDDKPTAALGRVFSRLGFVLLPASVLLIKYYPDVGRRFGEFGNEIVNTGVTENKNMLGVLALVISLGTLWQVLELVRNSKQRNRTRRLLAQGTLLCFGIFVLFTAHSATSGASFTIGAGLMLAISRPFFRSRPAAVHALVLAGLFATGIAVLVAEAEVMKTLGRNPDLTGRTEIWRTVIPMVPDPFLGAGFETFWLGPRVEQFHRTYGGIARTTEAHNGYIEVYLNLGWLGLTILALILGNGYRKTVTAFRRDSTIGVLLVTYVVTAVAYNIGEAGFRMLSLSWFFLLLTIVAASQAVRWPASTDVLLSHAAWQRHSLSPVGANKT